MGIFDGIIGMFGGGNDRNTTDRYLISTKNSENIENKEGGFDIVCPYCFHKFSPNEVHFRSRNEKQLEVDKEWDEFYSHMIPEFAKDQKMPKVIYPKSLPEANQIYNANGMLIDVIESSDDFKVIKDHDRLCPHCHNVLPKVAGARPIKIISIVGSTSVGKTVFLLKLLQPETKKAGGAISSIHLTGGESKQYITSKYKSIKEEGFNATTTMYIPPLSMEFLLPGESQDVIVSFFDFPGEAIASEYYRSGGDHLKNASAVMFLVDPTMSDIIKRSMDMSDIDDYNSESMDWNEAFANLYSNVFAATGETEYNKPTAIVFTKFDVILELLEKNNNSTFLSGFRSMGDYFKNYNESLSYQKRVDALDLFEIDKMSNMIKEFIKDVGQDNFMNSIDRRLPNSKYFGVSALGHRAKQGQPDETEDKPMYIDLPLLWLLYEMGYFPGKVVNPNYRDPNTKA